ncbi:MAG: hypothetical protein GDA36_12815 [Rhodobacteraceae bacterium]|nr:hypothetical protein [Paracoccaceae bacterium]
MASTNCRAVLHRGIGIAQSLKRRLQISLPRVFLNPAGVDAGRMTGGRSHDPVTVTTAQDIPVDLAGIGLVGQYPPACSPL